jgi:hypothetical protein
MQEQKSILSVDSCDTQSREELEQNMRARAWKDDAFRQEFLANPKAVLERDYAQYFPEGQIPSELSIKVIEEEEQVICFVLPSRLYDDQLPKLANIDDEELLDLAVGAGNTVRSFCTGCMVTLCCDVDLKRPNWAKIKF